MRVEREPRRGERGGGVERTQVVDAVLRSLVVAVQVDPFEKANFETGFSLDRRKG
jgi:hypothetical protein